MFCLILQSLGAVVLNSVQSSVLLPTTICFLDMEQPNPVDLCHHLHGLLPVSQPGIVSVYRALKQRPKTVMVATRFDLPVTLDTKPGWILQEIYNLWPDLSSGAGRVFQLIPILPRSLSIVHRPSSDIAYLLVLSRSLEMKQRAHCLMQICWGDRKWTTATMLPTFCNWYTKRISSTYSDFGNRGENGRLDQWRFP